MQYSVVIPLFNEEDNFSELHRRVAHTMSGLDAPYEIIYVDDGSEDATCSLIFELARENHHVVGVHLSRNFGQENAILAGIQCSQGEEIILLDGDLQDPPEFIKRLVEEKNNGYSVVYAIKSKRKENFLIKGMTYLFYKSMRFLSKVDIPQNVGTFSILSRNVAQHIFTLGENNKFIAGLRAFVGFKQKGIPYQREVRLRGKPKSIFGLVRMGLNAIFSFSILPLRITILAALIMGIVALFFLFDLGFQNSTGSLAAFGQNDRVIIFLLLQMFLVLAAVAIVCEYIGRIHEQIKKRPDFIIESIAREGTIIDDFCKIKAIENSFLKISQ